MIDLSRRTFLQRMTAAGLLTVAAPAIVRASSLEAIPVRHAWDLPPAHPVRWRMVLTVNNLGSTGVFVYTPNGHCLCVLSPGETADFGPDGRLVSGLRIFGGDAAVVANDLLSFDAGGGPWDSPWHDDVKWHYRGIARSLKGPMPVREEISWVEFDQ